MKPGYVVLLMGAAAVGGGLAVRYGEHPVVITQTRPAPPTVVAPPVSPAIRVGPSSSVPVHTAAARTADVLPDRPPAAAPESAVHPKAEKPSAFSIPVHLGKAEAAPVPPPPVSRRIIPPDPPAVTILERPSVVERAPTVLAKAAPPPVAATPAPAPAPPPVPLAPAPEANHATLREGMLISVRISEALSSNLNSSGDVFSGRLERPLIADGFVIAERGARVRGEVVDSKSSGDGTPNPELTLRLREILASDGQRVHIVSQPWRAQGPGYAARDNSRNVYDAALTRNGAAVIRPATNITFRLDQTVELTERR